MALNHRMDTYCNKADTMKMGQHSQEKTLHSLGKGSQKLLQDTHRDETPGPEPGRGRRDSCTGVVYCLGGVVYGLMSQPSHRRSGQGRSTEIHGANLTAVPCPAAKRSKTSIKDAWVSQVFLSIHRNMTQPYVMKQ